MRPARISDRLFVAIVITASALLTWAMVRREVLINRHGQDELRAFAAKAYAEHEKTQGLVARVLSRLPETRPAP